LEDLLEEIVGDITDEYDSSPETTEFTAPIPEGVHVLSGLLHHDEVLDITCFEMPEGNYETLAGFLLSLPQRIPQQGDHTCFRGWELIEMDGNRIAKLLLIAPGDDEARDDS
jgi:CBS domain containing-hemolysin-like protein